MLKTVLPNSTVQTVWRNDHRQSICNLVDVPCYVANE